MTEHATGKPQENGAIDLDCFGDSVETDSKNNARMNDHAPEHVDGGREGLEERREDAVPPDTCAYADEAQDYLQYVQTEDGYLGDHCATGSQPRQGSAEECLNDRIIPTFSLVQAVNSSGLATQVHFISYEELLEELSTSQSFTPPTKKVS